MRLPRDWLGSPDELVPIGGSDRPGRFADEEPGSEMPPAAEDFWGEDSAAVQDALQGPTRHEPSGPPATGLRPATGAPGESRGRVRGRWHPSHRARRSRGSHRSRLAAVAVAAIAGLALIVSIIGLGSSNRPRQNSRRPSASASGTAEQPASKTSLAASIKGIVQHSEQAAHRAAKDVSLRRNHAAARRRPATRHRRRRTPVTPPSQTFVSSPTQATTTTIPQQSSVSSGQNTAAATGASASQTPSASGSSTPPGPSGSVSLIGAGTSPSG